MPDGNAEDLVNPIPTQFPTRSFIYFLLLMAEVISESSWVALPKSMNPF